MGEILASKQAIINRWVEHCDSPLNSDNKHEDYYHNILTLLDNDAIPPPERDKNSAINKLKNSLLGIILSMLSCLKMEVPSSMSTCITLLQIFGTLQSYHWIGILIKYAHP
ncbi:hypothetical protein NPIL_392291 [Nephila pilipes]|uniref:Uncharacterized protein n=1 Tax=Nephila pilipes TaxID=299642 RepID=A0A8X6N840_NEPPI|nr:hypothetical protein NPIL_392291 [Nephila pilipes]